MATLAPELSGKRLELLKEIVPTLSGIAVFGISINPGNAQSIKETELAACQFGVQVQQRDILKHEDIDAAFRAAIKERADAILVLVSSVLNTDRREVVAVPARTEFR